MHVSPLALVGGASSLRCALRPMRAAGKDLQLTFLFSTLLTAWQFYLRLHVSREWTLVPLLANSSATRLCEFCT